MTETIDDVSDNDIPSRQLEDIPFSTDTPLGAKTFNLETYEDQPLPKTEEHFN